MTQVPRAPGDVSMQTYPATLQSPQATSAPCGAKKATCKAQASLTDYATPPSSVAAFCRAVVKKLIPRQLLGEGQEGPSNFKLVLQHVERFIKMRRFESVSLHEVCKGVKVRQRSNRLRHLHTDRHTRSQVFLGWSHSRSRLQDLRQDRRSLCLTCANALSCFMSSFFGYLTQSSSL